ncbi:MAG TPA: ribonuclease R [Candidatus Methylacidiphilales bacterium]|jgi:ribonuclease R|nr:ribonuclease R [Candidatus Methylacidiphilales bacterium]
MKRPRNRPAQAAKSQPKKSRPPQAHGQQNAKQRASQPPRQGKPRHAPAAPRPTARQTPPTPGPSAPLHWREGLLPQLAQPNYQPLEAKALARKLRVPPEDEATFSAFLAEQESAGQIMQVRHGLYVLPRRLGYSVGRLQMNERGFGFLVPIDPAEPDFYIAGDDTGTAFHGDLVLARLKEQHGRQRDSRQRGEVVKVLQRKRRQIVGTLNRTPIFFYVAPDEARIPYDISVATPGGSPPLGQKVVVELTEWTDRRKAPEGVITEVLGAPDEPGVDLLSIIRKHDLPTSFPLAVEQEAADIPAQISPQEITRREDFRKLFTMTIDPDDAKDFDDALSYQILPNGDFEIFIHIADVSHYVYPGTALDKEARSRGNSIYLVDRVIPMLPEKLSNGICSLQPNVDRLVKTAIVTLDRRGETKKFRFAAGIIHSAKRFTYQEAFAQLRKPANTPIGNALHELNAMAQTLRKRRFARGALDLDFPEVKVRVNELGIPTHLEHMENDISHQLIEEFMLLANEVVALELKRRQRPGIYRIHENPDPERLQEFRAQAKSMGFHCGDLTQRGEIQKLLNQVRGKPGESVVKIGLLKSLKRAMYSPKPLGHYGLAKQNYTHFTSPIRRYSDLLVHRVLFERGHATGDLSYDGLSRLALHLSTTERTAADAEQESVRLKKLEYFDRQAHATRRTSFTALIQEVRSSGLVVQLPEFVIQGMIPLSGLQGDLFVFNPQRLELHGQRSKITLRAGQTLQVEVARVDLGRQQVDFLATKQSLMKISH